MATARTNKITPPAIDNAPTVKWRKARSSSPRAMSTRATVAAVTSILRTTSRLAAASSGAVISRNGTSASLGPTPISSTKKVSITPAAVIEVCAIHQVCRKPGLGAHLGRSGPAGRGASKHAEARVGGH